MVPLAASLGWLEARRDTKEWYKQRSKVGAQLQKRAGKFGFAGGDMEDVSDLMKKTGSSNKPLKLALIDVLRAHFQANAEEPI